MRRARVVEAVGGFYHVISRVVARERLLRDEVDRELFRQVMRAMEAFSGCYALNWCCLFNHFHILLHVPAAQEVGDSELLARMRFLYKPEKVEEFAQELARYRETGQAALAELWRAPCRFEGHVQYRASGNDPCPAPPSSHPRAPATAQSHHP